MQCRKKKRDGTQCRARRPIRHKACALHAEPGKAAGLGSKGGRRQYLFTIPMTCREFAPPESAAGMREAAGTVIYRDQSWKTGAQTGHFDQLPRNWISARS